MLGLFYLYLPDMKAFKLFFVLILLVPFSCFAQFETDTILSHKDSLKMKGLLISAKKFNYDFTSLDSVVMDTFPHGFQIYNPAFQNRALNIFTGSLGGPMLSSLFICREPQQQYFFNQPIAYNFHNPSNIRYYTARTPYTQLTYFFKGTTEQSLNAIHTQNINKYLNVGFLGDLTYFEGDFNNQTLKSNSFTLHASYQRKRYSLFMNGTMSKYSSQENGGILEEDYLNTDHKETSVASNLEDASSSSRNRSFFALQRFYLTGSYNADSGSNDGAKWNEVLSLIHQINIDQSARGYKDKFSTTLSNTFYQNNYIDTLESNDSSSYRALSNRLMLALNANDWLHIPAELRFGVKNLSERVRYSIIRDSMAINDSTYQLLTPYKKNYLSNYFVASLTDRFSKTMKWGISAEYCFAGDLFGNTLLAADFEKTIWDNYSLYVKGQMGIEKPKYFLNNYFSNHYEWSNNFDKQQYTSVNARISLKKLKFWIEGRQDNYNNYIYFDSLALPKKANSVFSVMALTASKQFDLGFFHTEFQVSVQHSGNKEAIALPDFSGFNSTYFQFTLFKVLGTQIGWDIYYNTEYYANAYMPATGVFYSQNKRLIGNYPYGDVFANFKLKRARFFVKWERANSWIDQRGFFIPNYSYNPGSLKLGISWTFYD
jgi:hypothetical protein